MWKYSGRTIKEHKAWTDDNGITHPRNWHIWSPSEKAAAGLTEVTPETPPDSRLYHWGYEADGVTISKTAKSLTDVGVVDDDGNPVNDDDGNQIMEPGVRSQLKAEVKKQQGSLLAQTDWRLGASEQQHHRRHGSFFARLGGARRIKIHGPWHGNQVLY